MVSTVRWHVRYEANTLSQRQSRLLCLRKPSKQRDQAIPLFQRQCKVRVKY